MPDTAQERPVRRCGKFRISEAYGTYSKPADSSPLTWTDVARLDRGGTPPQGGGDPGSNAVMFFGRTSLGSVTASQALYG